MREDQSSASYTIDENYTIVTYNRAGKELYPQLELGKKCHKCLMDLDEPCGPCPVMNKIQGPRTYFDPIRKIYETVDAVEIYLEGGKIGHSLILSTTGERESISKQLPTTEEDLRKLLNQDLYDKLTGGYSRNGFIQEVEKILKDDGQKKNYAIIVLDIQKFKSINDVFGLSGGDRLLKDLFIEIKNNPAQPLVAARLDSDHFVCLMEREKLDFGIYEKILDVEWNYEGRVVQIHLNCGIYFVEDRSQDVSQMVEWAFMAKQYAEQRGIQKYAIFDDSMRKDYVGSAEILSSFRRGLEDREFKVYYQPIVNTKTGRIEAAEALVRWEHKKLGFITPDQFIPVLEKNGLITQLDHYVIKEVYRFLNRVRSTDLPEFHITINLSWQDFYDHGMMDEIIRLAQNPEYPRGIVHYEVTETSMAALEQNCAYILEQFRQCGAKALLDDFGTGVSSLGMIGNYSFDIVKIDRSFIRQIENNEKVRKLIRSIIRMCHGIGLKLVAEGVETKKQLQYLMDESCDYIQGYYFSRPLQEKDFLQYVAEYEKRKQELLPEESLISSERLLQEMGSEFFRGILDNIDYYVSVMNPQDDTLVYMNEASRSISQNPEQPYLGRKCYEYMLGLDAPCGHCPKNRMSEGAEKELVVDDGQYVFGVHAAMREINGHKVFVEIGRNITDAKELKARYTEQIKAVLTSLPDGQGVFHVDVTGNAWISSDGQAQNARKMQNVKDMDTLIRMISEFIPGEKGQEEFYVTFCRDAMLQAYARGEYHVVKDTLSYYDDGEIRWSRITAHLLMNPETDHLECLIYGVDVSKEYEQREKNLRGAREALELYTQADHDRRIDFLTGLHNRLDLNDHFRKKENMESITAMFMLDIDDFKKINDRYGHVVGDACLKRLGEVLNHFSETHGIQFFRYGGEEILGLLFEGCEEIERMSDEILNEVRRIVVETEDQEKISFTASLGYTRQVQSYEKMVDAADRAMYVAKRKGKDQFYCFEDVK